MWVVETQDFASLPAYPPTIRHSTGVAAIADGVASVLGFNMPARRSLRRAALLHDIGKLGISKHILDKNGPLTADEQEIMRKPPSYGYDPRKSTRYCPERGQPAAVSTERRGTRRTLRTMGERLTSAWAQPIEEDIDQALCHRLPWLPSDSLRDGVEALDHAD